MIRQYIVDGAREAGLVISQHTVQSLVAYSEELLKWNRKINLTAITDPREIAVKHFIDSMFFVQQVKNGERLLDIGSGAGIPSIPLKIDKPEVEVVSVDAVAKKIHFQRHVARILGLQKFDALHMRIEELAKTEQQSFDVITSRAFSSLEMFVTVSAPLLSKTGRLIAMKGPASDDEMKGVPDMLRSHGFEIHGVDSYKLPFNYGERRLITITYCK